MVKLYDHNDAPIPLPMKWQICGQCSGEGMSSAYLGAFTREDFDEDPDFAVAYMDGVYDRPCERCSGAGKVKVVDVARLSPDVRVQYENAVQEEREYNEMVRMEREMGA